jgi:hypothetical protein
MHIECLVEDASGAALMSHLLPKIIGDFGMPNTWRIRGYKGIGRLPTGLNSHIDPSKRALLNQLPSVLNGYGKTPGIDAVVVVLDSDKRHREDFMAELAAVTTRCTHPVQTLFGLATEEVEAWYLGDKHAIFTAYPHAKKAPLAHYVQDSVCGTWQLLADVLFHGGRKAVIKAGWPKPGQLKQEWANTIGPVMDVDNNESPSFCQYRDGLRGLLAG